MKGIFWNCNGLGDPNKFKFLSDVVREKSLDFIILSENGRRDCSMNFLKNLCEGKYYLWHCKAPRGWSGGMLLGINPQAFDVAEIEEGDFLVKSKLRNKNDDFKLILFSIYGAAQNHLKETILTWFDVDITPLNTSQGDEEEQCGSPTHLHHGGGTIQLKLEPISDSRSSPG